MPKTLDLSRHTMTTESIVLKLSPEAKKHLDYFFDTLNFVYGELKKNTEVNNIQLFLLSLKPKIDGFILSKNKEPVYKLLNVAINQWLQEDTGMAHLHLDQTSCIYKGHKISLPLPKCSKVDFICPDIYKRIKSAYYDPFIKIMKVKNVFIAEIVCYHPIPKPKKFYVLNDNKQMVSLDEKGFHKYRRDLKNQAEDHHQAYIKYREKFSNNGGKKKGKLLPTPTLRTEPKPTEPVKVTNSHADNAAAWLEFRKKFQETPKAFDPETVSEILEAFNEVRSRRSASNNEYLQNFYKKGSLGKFGLPQAKWRNGTYGINSKEPDFFSRIDK